MVTVLDVFHTITDNLDKLGTEYLHLTDEGMIKRNNIIFNLTDQRTDETISVKLDSEVKAFYANKYLDIIYMPKNIDEEVYTGKKLSGTYRIKIKYEKVVVDNPVSKNADVMMTIDTKYYTVDKKGNKFMWKKVKKHDDKIAVLNESIVRIVKSSLPES